MRHSSVVFALIVACSGESASTARSSTSDEALLDALGSASDAPLSVGLALSDKALSLSCRTGAAILRGIERDGDRFTATWLVVTDEHPLWTKYFLQDERLMAELIVLDREEFQDIFGNDDMPSIYVVAHGRVQWRSTISPGHAEDMRDAINELIDSAGISFS